MADASIVYFPVGNGDTSLIKLEDGTTILVDSNVTSDAFDENNNERFDVYNFLRQELRQENGVHHLDTFILTHADDDHCRGIDKMCYLGDPAKYTDTHKKEGLLIIDELWFTPRLFLTIDGKKCDCAKALKKEAERRIDLYKSGKTERTQAGNRLRIIGYTENEELKGLESIVTVPGHSLNLINGSVRDNFRFFIYAPVRKDTDDECCERNDSSIIFQARFDVNGEKNACIAFFGGDAGCAIWEKVIEKNSEENLKWDLFLAPHHCSWTFLSDDSSDVENRASKKVMDLLGMKREGAWVIASSKSIKRNEDNPPHYRAANVYKKAVSDEKFLCTSQHPDEKAPKPIIFLMSENGPVKGELNENTRSIASAAVKSVLSTPKTYGR
jgi:hypothetical protein